MVLAQKLYESGHISYMRTDSVNLSETALGQAKKQIETEFGKNYYRKRVFKTKTSGAQEAHEAIRPTDFKNLNAGDDPKQNKLYKLIWSRAIASQMTDAEIERTELSLANDGIKPKFIAKGEVVIFPGYLKAYQANKQAEPDILPDMQSGDILH